MLKQVVSITPLLRFPALVGAATIIIASGCSKDPGDGTPASAAAATTKGKRPDPAAAGEKGAAEGPGGRRAASIILAATDVKAVERGSIEAGVAVSGDLKAIEEAVVRARLEGDLVGVYAREAEEAYRLAALRFERGLDTQLDASAVQLQLLVAKTNEARSIFDLYIAAADLARARGIPIPLPPTRPAAAPSR